jgi:hypothetical protein
MRGNIISKYLASLVFTLTVTAATPALAETAATQDETNASATGAAQQVRMPVPFLREEASMVLVGTMLIGLAAAVRRAA